jgi:hypothetical protein
MRGLTFFLRAARCNRRCAEGVVRRAGIDAAIAAAALRVAKRGRS